MKGRTTVIVGSVLAMLRGAVGSVSGLLILLNPEAATGDMLPGIQGVIAFEILMNSALLGIGIASVAVSGDSKMGQTIRALGIVVLVLTGIDAVVAVAVAGPAAGPSALGALAFGTFIGGSLAIGGHSLAQNAVEPHASTSSEPVPVESPGAVRLSGDRLMEYARWLDARRLKPSKENERRFALDHKTLASLPEPSPGGGRELLPPQELSAAISAPASAHFERIGADATFVQEAAAPSR